MNIENILKEYKVKKSYVDTTLARIEQWKYVLNHPELWEVDFYDENLYKSIDYSGMPGAPRGSAPAPSSVENCAMNKMLNESKLKDWIRNDQSRLFLKKLEVEQIETALNSLTSQERFIIELKYFDNMFWKDIEINFNHRYRPQNYVTFEMLKKKNKEALNKLKHVLLPLYNQFLIA
jgi:hypothetical protein